MMRLLAIIIAALVAAAPSFANMPGTFGGLLLSRNHAPNVTYITDGTSGSGTSATYTSASIGAASSDRLVVVAATCDSAAGTANQITSITIGGNAATIHENPSGGRAPTAIASLIVTSGTTATIVATASASCNSHAMAVWTITDYASSTPYSTSGGQNLSATGTSVSVTLDLPDYGAAIFIAQRRGSTQDMVWSSATESNEFAASLNRISAAVKSTTNSIAGHTETVSWTTSNVARGLSGVSWR